MIEFVSHNFFAGKGLTIQNIDFTYKRRLLVWSRKFWVSVGFLVHYYYLFFDMSSLRAYVIFRYHLSISVAA